MNTRQAKRQVCAWAADTLAAAQPPHAGTQEDKVRLERAAQQLINEMERRGGVAQMMPSTFDVPLFVLDG